MRLRRSVPIEWSGKKTNNNRRGVVISELLMHKPRNRSVAGLIPAGWQVPELVPEAIKSLFHDTRGSVCSSICAFVITFFIVWK